MPLPLYAEVREVFARTDVLFTPAEIHGVICGLLVKNPVVPADRIEGIVLGKPDKANVLDGEASRLVGLLLEVTRTQLQDPLLSLELLLPDDDEDLDVRLACASGWTRGLLLGLAGQDVDKPQALPEDTASFLQDCRTLAANEYSTDNAGEDEEAVYAELVEYLRMGTLLAQEELTPLKSTPHMH